jgi:hypothetical protein
MSQHYRLLITGSIPLEFEDGELIPHTPQDWHDLFENQEVNIYDLDKLVLQLVPQTPDEIAADEAELQRKIVYARQVGAQMRRAWNERHQSL